VGAFAKGIPGKISTFPGWPMIVALGNARDTVGLAALTSAAGAAKAKGSRVRRTRKFMTKTEAAQRAKIVTQFVEVRSLELT